ncbi:hypothetical protein E2C01_056668 [Portunus trituberculatus]|uniref:Secreted protein n=1 Tax=Portunus trituberculatus TaxID=210409 RepID=A0A5B7GUS4_PORTR|nr:hypothetical protein [Portunus trituberculatus]
MLHVSRGIYTLLFITILPHAHAVPSYSCSTTRHLRLLCVLQTAAGVRAGTAVRIIVREYGFVQTTLHIPPSLSNKNNDDVSFSLPSLPIRVLWLCEGSARSDYGCTNILPQVDFC